MRKLSIHYMLCCFDCRVSERKHIKFVKSHNMESGNQMQDKNVLNPMNMHVNFFWSEASFRSMMVCHWYNNDALVHHKAVFRIRIRIRPDPPVFGLSGSGSVENADPDPDPDPG